MHTTQEPDIQTAQGRGDVSTVTELLRRLLKQGFFSTGGLGNLSDLFFGVNTKIAQEYWRLSVGAWHEAEELGLTKPFVKTTIYRILRYQTTINRQLFQAMNQLERLQRLRKGDNVPAPLSVQVSHETPTLSEGEKSPTISGI